MLRLFNLQERDRGHLRAFTPVFMLVTAANVVTVSFAKSLFISSNEASDLPWMFISASLFTAFAAMTYVGLTGRASPQRRFDVLLVVAIASFSLLGVIIDLDPPAVSLIIYAWSTGIGQLIIIQSWAYTATVIPTRSARRLFPVFAAAATLGAAAGGFLTRSLLPLMGLSGLIHVAVVLLAGTFFSMRHAIRQLEGSELASAPAETAEGTTTTESSDDSGRLARVKYAFTTLRKYPLMSSIAALAFFTQLASVTLDFQFSVALKAEFDGEKMAAFFGLYYGLASLLSLVIGLLGGSRLTRSIGIGLAAAAAAAMLLLGSVASLILYMGGVTTLLWPIVAASFGERVLSFGVSKPALQAAFTPVPAKAVEAGKFIIDGVIYRLATLSISVALLVWAGDLLDYGKLSPLVLVFSLIAIVIGWRMARHYRNTLFSGLRDRRVATDDASAPWAERDARTVVRTLLATGNPEDVVQGLELARELRLEPPKNLVRRLSVHPEPIVVIDLLQTLTTLDIPPQPDMLEGMLANPDEGDPGILRAALRALPRGAIAATPEYQSLVPLIEELTHHADPAVASLAFVWLRANATTPIGATRLLTYELRLMRDLASKDRKVAVGAVQQVAALGRSEYIAPLLDAVISPALRATVFEALKEFPRQRVFADISKRLAVTDGLSDVERVWLLRLAEELGGAEAAELIAPYVEASSDVVKDQATRSLWNLDRDGWPAERAPLLLRASTEVDALIRLALFDSMVRRTLEPGPRATLLSREVALRRSRGERRAFRLLGLLYSRQAVERAFLGYRDSNVRVRSNAIELLDSTVEDPEVRDFIAYVEASERVDGMTQTTISGSDGLLQRFARYLGDAVDGSTDPALSVLGERGADGWIGDVYRWAASPETGETELASAAEQRWQRLLLLTHVGLFRRVPAKDLEPISALAIPTRFRSGEVLFKQGDVADDLYLIVDGDVAVVTRERGRVAVLRSGECVGEMGVLDDAPRSATVTALAPVQALRIERPDFEDLLELFPAVSRGIIDVLTQRLRTTQAAQQASTSEAA